MFITSRSGLSCSSVRSRPIATESRKASAGTNGCVLVVFRTPNWEDFVSLAVTEIRQYGATSIQVTRRLQAMLENLFETLPEFRRPVLEEELALLSGTIKRAFVDPEERDRASVGDLQGVGGRTPANRRVGRFALKT